MDDRIASFARSFRIAQCPHGPSGQAAVATIETRSSAFASQSTASPATAQKTIKYRPSDSSGQYVGRAADQLFHEHGKVRRHIS